MLQQILELPLHVPHWSYTTLRDPVIFLQQNDPAWIFLTDFKTWLGFYSPLSLRERVKRIKLWAQAGPGLKPNSFPWLHVRNLFNSTLQIKQGENHSLGY